MVETTPHSDVRSNECDTSPSGRPSVASCKKRPRDVQKSSRRSIWLDSWLFEWITLAFSIACFVAVSIVLWIHDGKVRPDMAHDVSLNTIISVLATGCKSALVLVIGEAISQLKWLWFREPTQSQSQLVGIQRFDAASRGPLGSLLIIIHHRARSLVSLGALVTILLLAFDPFMQQVLSYPVRSTPDSSIMARARAPQIREYVLMQDQDKWGNAFAEGFFSSQDFAASLQCSSGNCTWDIFSSIGLCSQCSDMTTTAVLDCDFSGVMDLRAFNKTCTIALPDSPGYNFTVVHQTSMRDSLTPEFILPSKIIWEPLNLHRPTLPDYTLAGVKNPLWTIAYAELEVNTDQVSRNASFSDIIYAKNVTGCILSTCLREYHVTVENGNPSIRSQNIDFGTIYLNNTISYDRKYEMRNTLCWMPGPPDAAGYQGIGDFVFCDSEMWDLARRGQVYFPSMEKTRWEYNRYRDVWDTTDRLTNSTISFESYRDPKMERFLRVGLEKSIANMAASLTKLGLENTNHSVNGTVHVAKVFVKVRWSWIFLPTSVVLTGALFMVATIYISKNSHMPLWKSSALVPFYHGSEILDADGSDDEYLAASTIEKKAERQQVRWQRSENNGRLMLRQQATTGASEPFLQPG